MCDNEYSPEIREHAVPFEAAQRPKPYHSSQFQETRRGLSEAQKVAVAYALKGLKVEQLKAFFAFQ